MFIDSDKIIKTGDEIVKKAIRAAKDNKLTEFKTCIDENNDFYLKTWSIRGDLTWKQFFVIDKDDNDIYDSYDLIGNLLITALIHGSYDVVRFITGYLVKRSAYYLDHGLYKSDIALSSSRQEISTSLLKKCCAAIDKEKREITKDLPESSQIEIYCCDQNTPTEVLNLIFNMKISAYCALINPSLRLIVDNHFINALNSLKSHESLVMTPYDFDEKLKLLCQITKENFSEDVNFMQTLALIILTKTHKKMLRELMPFIELSNISNTSSIIKNNDNYAFLLFCALAVNESLGCIDDAIILSNYIDAPKYIDEIKIKFAKTLEGIHSKLTTIANPSLHISASYMHDSEATCYFKKLSQEVKDLVTNEDGIFKQLLKLHKFLISEYDNYIKNKNISSAIKSLLEFLSQGTYGLYGCDNESYNHDELRSIDTERERDLYFVQGHMLSYIQKQANNHNQDEKQEHSQKLSYNH